MGCKYRVMDKCKAKGDIKDAVCVGKDSCLYYEEEAQTIPKADYELLRASVTMMKADYNARLKADMVAILEKLNKEINELCIDNPLSEYEENMNRGIEKAADVIQQKIGKLKEN